MHFYIKRDLLNKIGKGERYRQVSKVVGIRFSSCFWGGFLSSKQRGDAEFHKHKFALRVTDLGQKSD